MIEQHNFCGLFLTTLVAFYYDFNPLVPHTHNNMLSDKNGNIQNICANNGSKFQQLNGTQPSKIV